MALERSLGEVHEHLRLVLQKPSTTLDGRLLEHIDRQVSGPYECHYTTYIEFLKLKHLLTWPQKLSTTATEASSSISSPSFFPPYNKILRR